MCITDGNGYVQPQLGVFEMGEGQWSRVNGGGWDVLDH